MRIAVNTRFLLPGRMEGIGRFTWEVARRIAAQHPEHEFYFLFDRPFYPDFIPAPNVHPVVVYPPARHPLLWYLWFEWAVPAALRRSRADVFLSPDGYCSLSSPVATVMVTHDLAHVHFPDAVPPMVRKYYDHFVPQYLRRAEKVVAVSAFTARDIQAQYRIPRDKIHIACNGCDPAFQPLPESEKQIVRAQYSGNAPYFFYIAAIHPRKNAERLIAAFDDFKTRTGAPCKLLLAGRLAWQTGTLHDALAGATHRKDIQLLGYVPDEALPRLTGAALALTYVSLFEGFGVPLLEAMHCDVPLLCSDAASMPEVAGEAALYVDPHTTASISSGMERLWKEEALRAALVEKGRMQRQRFSWDQAAQVVMDAVYAAASH